MPEEGSERDDGRGHGYGRVTGEVPWSRGPNVPASALYVAVEDTLVVRSVAAVVVRLAVRLRLQQDDGRIAFQVFDVTTTADREPQTVAFNPGEGYLLSVTVEPLAGSFRHGQVFAEVGLLRGLTTNAVITHALISDYVQPSLPRGWPGGVLRSSADGPGVIRAVVGANPAAGVAPTITVPTGARWRVLAFGATLVTDATVANRFPHFEVFDPGAAGVVFRGAPVVAQAASLTVYHQAAPLGAGLTTTDGVQLHQAPIGLLATALQVLRFTTTNLQAADDWGIPVAIVEEWLETETQA